MNDIIIAIINYLELSEVTELQIKDSKYPPPKDGVILFEDNVVYNDTQIQDEYIYTITVFHSDKVKGKEEAENILNLMEFPGATEVPPFYFYFNRSINGMQNIEDEQGRTGFTMSFNMQKRKGLPK